jgi:16S rRNA (guanine527-N7)-methyltransferase
VGPEDRAWVLDSLQRAQSLGFLGPVGVETHVAHAEAFAAAVGPEPGLALDLGSGGGVPGLVLAASWPGSRWLLLDASLRRTVFLAEVVAELGWADRIEVRRQRAEPAGRDPELRGRFDLVVARSFAGPAATAECAAPFLRTGGILAVSEPSDGSGRWPADGLDRLGLRLGRHVVWPEIPATIQLLVQVGQCPDRYPRRTGVPSKRPLW